MKNLLLLICLIISVPVLSNQSEPTVENGKKEQKYFPILKNGDWAGLDKGAVHQPFIGQKEHPEVVISYALDEEKSYIFLNESDKNSLDFDMVRKHAFDNLNSIEVTFDMSDDSENPMLFASGKPFSSEAILSSKQMQKAHKLLNAKQILVSIPRRTVLTAVSREADPDTLRKFIYFHNYTWEDDSYGNARITNDLFVLENGEIVGTIPMKASGSD